MPSGLRFAAIVALIFAALQSTAGASSLGGLTNFYCATASGTVPDLATCINSAVPFVFIAILLSFTIVAISYLIGEVLAIQSFKGWYKGELWEAIKSLLIVGVILSVIVISGSLASLLPGVTAPLKCLGASASTNGFDLMYYTAYSTFGTGCSLGSINYTNESFNNLLGISMGAEFLKSIRLNTYFTIPFPPIPVAPQFGSLNIGSDLNLYSGSIIDANPITGGSHILGLAFTFLIFPMMLVLETQYAIFIDVIAISLGVLLPLGLIFRATPFLRPIGATLIALAIAGAIIYPALLAMFNAPIVYFFSPLYPENSGAILNAFNSSCPGGVLGTLLCGVISEFNPLVGVVFSGLPGGLGSSTIIACPPIPFLTTGENDYWAFFTGYCGALSAFVGGDIYPILNPMFIFMLPVVIQFVLFILDLIIGVTIAQGIARALGGQIKLGVGKMKLA